MPLPPCNLHFHLLVCSLLHPYTWLLAGVWTGVHECSCCTGSCLLLDAGQTSGQLLVPAHHSPMLSHLALLPHCLHTQIAPLRPVPAAHKPVPATHKAAATTHKAAATTHKAVSTTHKASGSSASPGRFKQPLKAKAPRVHFEEPAGPSKPQPTHTAPLRPAHAPKRRKLSTEQTLPGALDSPSMSAPACKPTAAGASAPGRHKAEQQAQAEFPTEPKASKGE